MSPVNTFTVTTARARPDPIPGAPRMRPSGTPAFCSLASVRKHREDAHADFVATHEAVASATSESDRRIAVRQLLVEAANADLRRLRRLTVAPSTPAALAAAQMGGFVSEWQTLIAGCEDHFAAYDAHFATIGGVPQVPASQAALEVISSLGIWFSGPHLSIPMRPALEGTAAAARGGCAAPPFRYSHYVMHHRQERQRRVLEAVEWAAFNGGGWQPVDEAPIAAAPMRAGPLTTADDWTLGEFDVDEAQFSDEEQNVAWGDAGASQIGAQPPVLVASPAPLTDFDVRADSSEGDQSSDGASEGDSDADAPRQLDDDFALPPAATGATITENEEDVAEENEEVEEDEDDEQGEEYELQVYFVTGRRGPAGDGDTQSVDGDAQSVDSRPLTADSETSASLLGDDVAFLDPSDVQFSTGVDGDGRPFFTFDISARNRHGRVVSQASFVVGLQESDDADDADDDADDGDEFSSWDEDEDEDDEINGGPQPATVANRENVLKRLLRCVSPIFAAAAVNTSATVS